MTCKTIASVGLALILTALATTADAKSRKHRDSEASTIKLLLEMKRDIASLNLRLERAGLSAVPLPRGRVVASADPSLPMPRRNPLAVVAPMTIPDASKTLAGYSKHINKNAPLTKGLGNVQGLQKAFLTKLASMRSDMPAGTGFSVGSGFRTRAQQARLYALKPHLAARPGRSRHEQGLAGDLRYASDESRRWIHRNAGRYGLRFPMGYEPWHIEPAGLTRTRYAARHHKRYAAVQ